MEKKLRQKLKGGDFRNVPKDRSKTMSRIRGKGNKTTEAKFRFALVSAGIRGWKLHPKNIPGSPDIYFPSEKLAIFLDGCFWHGCPRCGHIPKTRTDFWREKFKRNKARDKKTTLRLNAMGISVLRFWEHEIVNDVGKCLEKLMPRLSR